MEEVATGERLCVDCGEPIPPERVAALPNVTLCITCKGGVERRDNAVKAAKQSFAAVGPARRPKRGSGGAVHGGKEPNTERKVKPFKPDQRKPWKLEGWRAEWGPGTCSACGANKLVFELRGRLHSVYQYMCLACYQSYRNERRARQIQRADERGFIREQPKKYGRSRSCGYPVYSHVELCRRCYKKRRNANSPPPTSQRDPTIDY